MEPVPVPALSRGPSARAGVKAALPSSGPERGTGRESVPQRAPGVSRGPGPLRPGAAAGAPVVVDEDSWSWTVGPGSRGPGAEASGAARGAATVANVCLGHGHRTGEWGDGLRASGADNPD